MVWQCFGNGFWHWTRAKKTLILFLASGASKLAFKTHFGTGSCVVVLAQCQARRYILACGPLSHQNQLFISREVCSRIVNGPGRVITWPPTGPLGESTWTIWGRHLHTSIYMSSGGPTLLNWMPQSDWRKSLLCSGARSK